MRRVPKLTARFLARRGALASPGVTARAVVRAIGSLCRDPLPGPDDFETFMPPVSPRYWCRPVPGIALWIYFAFDDREVHVLNLTNRAPPVLEPDE